MCNNHTNLGFIKKEFPQGTHICLIYKDERQREKVISNYLYQGLYDSEKVSYFSCKANFDDVINLLQKVHAVKNKEHLEVLNAVKTYCPTGTFVPEIMLDNLRKFYSDAKSNGYQACRVSGEMHWALSGIPGSDRIMEYEAQVNNVVKTHPVTAICQYDARLFSGEDIINCLKVHPFMIINGQVIENPYYLKPEEFLKENKHST